MKVLIIGIDGGTWNVLGPACDKGLMPNLNRFRTEGAWGNLQSVHPPITPAAWTTFMTGMNPGHHGVRGFFDYDPVQNKTVLTNSSDIQKETLWQKLGRHGKKSIVIGLPMTYPPLKIDGILVSGLGTPSTNCDFTHPAEFKQDVLREIPDLKFVAPYDRKQVRQEKNFAEYLDWHKENSDNLIKILRMAMDKTQWAVSMVLLRSFDEIMHNFWKLLDFKWDTGFDPRDGMIIRYFKELDEVIGTLMQIAQENQAVMLVASDHGGQAKLVTIYPNKILEQLGYLKLMPKNKLLAQKIQDRLRKMNPFAKSSKSPDERVESVDFSASRAVVTGVNSYADLYVQDSALEPGQSKEDLINQVKRDLLAVKDLDGEPLFTMIVTPHEVYGLDPSQDAKPDLMIAARDGYTFNSHAVSKTILKKNKPNSFSGYHSINGMVGLIGPQIASGKTISAKIDDIVPTILAILDLPVTKDMDGIIMEDAFTTPPQVEYEDPIDIGGDDSYCYSDKENDEINTRLENLGYL